VGAHRAEELESYRKSGFGPVIWVEAQESLIPLLTQRTLNSDDQVFQGVAWSKTGEQFSLKVASNSQSTSVFDFATHSKHYPHITTIKTLHATTTRLDDLLPSEAKFDFVNLDIQGAELEALMGLGRLMVSTKWVYSEVNSEELYSGIPLVGEIDDFLKSWNLIRLVTVWNQAGWGDALYGRRHPCALFRVFQRFGASLITWKFRANQKPGLRALTFCQSAMRLLARNVRRAKSKH